MHKYNFYLPDMQTPLQQGESLATENWPFNPSLKYTDPVDPAILDRKHHTQFTQDNYFLTPNRPSGNYFYYVNLDVTRLQQMNMINASNPYQLSMKFKLPDDVNEDISSGKAKLVLDSSREGFHSRVFNWDRLYAVTKLAPTDMILLSGDYARQTHMHIPTAYRGSWEYHYGTFAAKDSLIKDHYDDTIVRILTRGSRKWHGLSLNRLLRPHRIMVAKNICERGLSRRINYSFGIVTHHSAANNDDAFNHNNRLFDIISGGTEKKFSLEKGSIGPWITSHGEKNIDEEQSKNLHNNMAANLQSTMTAAHFNSYFSIVSETTFDNETIFMSEKVFKPILMMHPFVVAGDYKTIAAMKELGYNTFDNHIDHSYDSIQDPVQRMKTLFDEIERLCNIDRDTWNEMLYDMLPDLMKNYAHLQTSRYRNTEFHTALYQGQEITLSPSHHF